MANKVDFNTLTKSFKADVIGLVWLMVIALIPFALSSLVTSMPLQFGLCFIALFWFYYWVEKSYSKILLMPHIESQFFILLVSFLLFGLCFVSLFLGSRESLSVSVLMAVVSVVITCWPFYFRTRKKALAGYNFKKVFSLVVPIIYSFNLVVNYDNF